MKHSTLKTLAYKKDVDAYIRSYLNTSKTEFCNLQWTNDAFLRIAKFAVAGKTVRGSLIVYTYRMFQRTMPESVLMAAAAIELYHAALLVHDDIMDRDLIRRGMPSIHSQYEHLAATKNGSDIAHFGISQAINLGDVCMFLASTLISRINAASVSVVFSRELTAVALGQMQDVAGGHIPSSYTTNDILSLYLHKTARYTFSLPFAVGALLAGIDSKVVATLELLGEKLGILFQIRDDELSSSGDISVTGKPTGSDTKNRKQTLAHAISHEQIEAFKKELHTESQHIIRSLAIPSQRQQELTRLLTFCNTRKH